MNRFWAIVSYVVIFVAIGLSAYYTKQSYERADQRIRATDLRAAKRVALETQRRVDQSEQQIRKLRRVARQNRLLIKRIDRVNRRQNLLIRELQRQFPGGFTSPTFTTASYSTGSATAPTPRPGRRPSPPNRPVTPSPPPPPPTPPPPPATCVLGICLPGTVGTGV